VARESYGRLVAYLSSNTRDVSSAEDALSNALLAALETWPRDGVPQMLRNAQGAQFRNETPAAGANRRANLVTLLQY